MGTPSLTYPQKVKHLFQIIYRAFTDFTLDKKSKNILYGAFALFLWDKPHM